MLKNVEIEIQNYKRNKKNIEQKRKFRLII